jgi:hypothetical protein
MKKYLLAFLLLISSINYSFSQNNQGDSLNEPTITEVITIDSTSSSQLYERAKIWLVKTFKSSKDVIQIDDKENGKIIAKGVVLYDAPAFVPGTNFSGYFEFILTIETKNNKFRYTFEGFRHVAYKDGYSGGAFENEKPECGTFILTKNNWYSIKAKGTNSIKEIAESLRIAMKENTKKDEW